MRKKVLYPKGTLCCRCGMSKKETKKISGACSVYGTTGRHVWNLVPLKVMTHFITIKS